MLNRFALASAGLGQRRVLVLSFLVAGAVLGGLLAVGMAPVVLPLALVLTLADIGRELRGARRQLAALRRQTNRSAGTYPEELASVRELTAILSTRAGEPSPEILVASNPQIGLFAVFGRHLCVSAGLLASIAAGRQSEATGQATIAHELGHAFAQSVAQQTLVYLVLRALRFVVLAWAGLAAGLVVTGATPASMFGLALLALLVVPPLEASLEQLYDAAGELAADRYAATLLGDPYKVAHGIAALDLSNMATVLAGSLTWIGARQVIHSLDTLAPLYPQARIEGATLAEGAAMLRAMLAEEGPHSFGEHLDDTRVRSILAWRRGVVASHPQSGDRVRLLCGTLAGYTRHRPPAPLPEPVV